MRVLPGHRGRATSARTRVIAVRCGAAGSGDAGSVGELKRGTSVTLLLDAICGGCLNHALATPDKLRPDVKSGLGKYARQLVDFVLGPMAAG